MSAVEYYTAFKRKQSLSFMTTWMGEENMECQINQTQNISYVTISLYGIFKKLNSEKLSSWLSVAEGRERDG